MIGDRKAMFDPKKNPSLEHMEVALFLASAFIKRADTTLTPDMPLASLQSEVVNERGAAINHRHTEFHNEQVGFFGFFRTSTIPRYQGAVGHSVGWWVAGRGMTAIRGR
ncbi:hypothetical protein [Candidatus Amarobacter glycogenicus]|uniref:hypothetical protein n=1 Tax=Candidatus Amarobacter glycogenicus TaxID=3140699 RepID=UPI003135EF7C|nr:hypothetical protein [Dehalococcoidia bacterium]